MPCTETRPNTLDQVIDKITMEAWVWTKKIDETSMIIVNKEHQYEMQIGREGGKGPGHFEAAIAPNWEWKAGGAIVSSKWNHVAVTITPSKTTG